MSAALAEIDSSERIIYLDHAATTPVRPEVLEAMLPYFSDAYGNPSSLYAIAGESRNAIANARSQVAKVLNCRTSEIVFTGGGTEADNLALKGIAASHDGTIDVLVSEVEHHAVIHAAEQLERDGHNVVLIPVNRYGVVDHSEVEKRLSTRDAIVSVMYANNEVGAVNDIAEISRVAKSVASERNTHVYVHTDAVQSSGKLPLDVNKLGVDLLSLSAHKIHGPKGVGVLYVRRGVKLDALIAGGGQERQRRSGTENVPGIVGMGMSLTLSEAEREDFCLHTRSLRDRFLRLATSEIEGLVVNNHPVDCLPHIAHVSVLGLEGEPMLLGLDFKGVCASSGSACSSASIEPSHVLVGMGMDLERAAGSLRFSFGKDSKDSDVEYAVVALAEVVAQLRGMPSMRRNAA